MMEKIIKRILSLLSAGIFILAIGTVSKWLSDIHMVFELLSNFVFQYAVVATLSALIFLAARQFKWFLLSFMCVVINVAQIVPYYLNTPANVSALESTAALKILHANVLSSNQNYQALLDEVDQTQPDVIFLQEVNTSWLAGIGSLKNKYPYVHLLPRNDNFGIAMLSRLPVENVQTRALRSDVPSIEATLSIQGKKITLLSTHPVPPISSDYLARRNDQLLGIANWSASKKDQSLVVIGDLNLTMFSNKYGQLENAGLSDCRKGFGINPTWPAGSVLTPILKIALDHCFVTGANVRSFGLGNDIGSDHLPVVVEIAF
jgi:endonuclease/exonuclease/phosphatase (EEP) superfamily protein YafD